MVDCQRKRICFKIIMIATILRSVAPPGPSRCCNCSSLLLAATSFRILLMLHVSSAATWLALELISLARQSRCQCSLLKKVAAWTFQLWQQDLRTCISRPLDASGCRPCRQGAGSWRQSDLSLPVAGRTSLRLLLCNHSESRETAVIREGCTPVLLPPTQGAWGDQQERLLRPSF